MINGNPVSTTRGQPHGAAGIVGYNSETELSGTGLGESGGFCGFYGIGGCLGVEERKDTAYEGGFDSWHCELGAPGIGASIEIGGERVHRVF